MPFGLSVVLICYINYSIRNSPRCSLPNKWYQSRWLKGKCLL